MGRSITKFFLSSVIFFVFLTRISFAGVSLEKDPLEVHFINVGDGDAILVKFPDDTNFLIDAGRKEYATEITHYLKLQGVTKIDQAVLTHPHLNHFGGFETLLEHFSIEKFYINDDEKQAEIGYAELMQKMEERNISIAIVMRDDMIPAKDVSIKVLHPANLSASANDNSTVIWLSYGQTRFLFTSDVGEITQDEIIKLYPEIQSVDVVQVPHHGKDVSDKFARFFNGKIFAVSTGEYEGKAPDLRALTKLKGKILRTDKAGTVVIKSDGSTIEVASP